MGSGGGTPVQSSRSPVSGASGSASAFADDQIINRVSLSDIEKLIVGAGLTVTPSSKYPGFLVSYHPNGIRFHASGLACQDQTKMLGCAAIYLLVDVSVKTMKTVLQHPDEDVTWEAINRANSEMQLITVFYDQPNDTVKMKRVLLVGDGGQAAGNIESEIAVFPESAKTVIDDYIWPRG